MALQHVTDAVANAKVSCEKGGTGTRKTWSQSPFFTEVAGMRFFSLWLRETGKIESEFGEPTDRCRFGKQRQKCLNCRAVVA